MAALQFKHMKRGLLMLVEASLMLAVLLFFTAAGVLWRLSSGPLNIDFLSDRLEQSFGAEVEGFKAEVGSTWLVWGGRFDPFAIELKNVRVSRRDNTPVLLVERVGIDLSKRNLLIGRVVPRRIKIMAPRFRLIRWEDGHMTLNMDLRQAEAAAPLPDDDSGISAEDHRQVFLGLLAQLRDREGLGVLGGLREIVVSNASISYHNRLLDVVWQSRDLDLVFSRTRRDLSMAVSLSFAPRSDAEKAVVKGQVLHDWNKRTTRADFSFSGLNPAMLAEQNESLKPLSGIALPLKGRVQAMLDAELDYEYLRFAVGAGEGSVAVEGFYPEPLPVKAAYISGTIDGARKEAALDKLRLDLGGPVIEATGAAVAEGEGGARLVTLDAVMTDMPIETAPRYWPDGLATDVREWIRGHLFKGVATRATLGLALVYDAGAETEFTLRKVGGEIDFNGIRVDYFPPMMVVDDARGRAVYDHADFKIGVDSARLGDMAVGKSHVHLLEIDQQTETRHAIADILATVKGPVKTALRVLETKPLEYPKMLGIDVDSVEGVADVTLSLRFPLYNELQLNEVAVKADAVIDNVRLQNMVAGLPLTGGPLQLSVTNGLLSVKGNARLSGMATRLDWKKSFDEASPFSSTVTASLPVQAEVLGKFGVPADLNIVGTLPVDITYTEKFDKTASLSLKGDMTQASFTLPYLGYQKPVGAKAAVSFDLALAQDRPQRLSNLVLTAEGIDLAGNIDFAPDGSLKRLSLPRFVFGQTNASVSAENSGAGGYRVNISGNLIDASSFFGDEKPGDDQALAQPVTPVYGEIAVDKLMTGDKKALEQARITFQRNKWQRLDRLDVNGTAGGKPLSVRYGTGSGLRVDAGNAGAALSVLGVTDTIRGGKLAVNAKRPEKGGLRDLSGAAMITDFGVRNAPVLATLLNALSVPGLLSLLSGEGLSFKKARVDFTLTDRGMPDQPQNVRLIRLKNGKTSGASLGLTFEGAIDNWKKTYDIEGTIIPVSDINKLISIIPIVGNVLTAGGEGMIAATYTIKGPMAKPSAMVNPLSVLAPGILRKIFFE